VPLHLYTQDRIAELRKELAALKSQSDESFAFAAQARSALPDVNELRVAVKDSSESPHDFFWYDPGPNLTPCRLSSRHGRSRQGGGHEGADPGPRIGMR